MVKFFENFKFLHDTHVGFVDLDLFNGYPFIGFHVDALVDLSSSSLSKYEVCKDCVSLFLASLLSMILFTVDIMDFGFLIDYRFDLVANFLFVW